MELTGECDSFPSYLNGNLSSIIIKQMDRYYICLFACIYSATKSFKYDTIITDYKRTSMAEQSCHVVR